MSRFQTVVFMLICVVAAALLIAYAQGVNR
jgi:hypothetical protein